MYNPKTRVYLSHVFYGIFCLLTLFLQFSGLVTLKIGVALPMILVSLTIFAGMFFREWIGAVYGVLIGVTLDVVMDVPVGFNTVVLMLIGFLSGLLVTYLFNRNAYTMFVLNLLFTSFYFLLRWLFCYMPYSDTSYRMIGTVLVPQIIYTCVLGTVLYFFISWLLSKINKIN